MQLVFSDLDGTLLDHETYDFAPALPALQRLKELNIPLILASSKTEAEMRPIAAELGLDEPMIVENGAGIAGSDPAHGTSTYAQLRQCLNEMPPELRGRFQGFGDWSVEEVAKRTGMTPAKAELARRRAFSEPGLWSGSNAQRAEFEAYLAESGFQAVRGGRFYTLMPKTSKAERMAEITATYQRMSPDPVSTIALGDAPNDLAMIEAANHGFIIANPAHDPLPVTERERQGFIRRSQKAGPAGWSDMILQLLG
ncbi:HAD-IIB family hydrolase [Martelella alba]|uniref:HAD-IIB family hydrolase n=1 Tax=Martelella alba TaxID=2590451 RepID=A0A506U9E6_9HYPH|nr:HAD-IIB family hydrolase [Martelella alba]TPW30158.1 HAD-IIB family hydrolase [Martelella alba]